MSLMGMLSLSWSYHICSLSTLTINLTVAENNLPALPSGALINYKPKSCPGWVTFQISEILPSLTSLLKLAIKLSNAHLSFAGLSCLPVVLNRLSRLVSDSKAGSLPVIPLRSIINSLYFNSSGSVVSFLGDSKLCTRELACSALCAIASLAFEYHRKVNQLNFSSKNSNLQKSEEALAEIERIIKDQALANKVARARAQAIYFLSETRACYPGLLLIRSYLPILVSLLEDSDASV
ncbi:hypothetical protein PPACK8108_LOCUS5450 [Phakopsora pachyrhizi]|uniref:Uncharacterized protein n=1 Tax=Phakopsora pachyrhizi TaxID=170000 RepID=A0AAV0AQY1_PHAPC|nr:hypothetical protein PPACK8108_LOCUS5450 [Phakopsora pachyrhizi]